MTSYGAYVVACHSSGQARGAVVGQRDGEGKDIAAFKAQVRRAFQLIQTTLNAARTNFDDAVMLNTFHVWQDPNFEGDPAAQFAAFSAVKDEFMKAPYPAWTVVGTTALIPDPPPQVERLEPSHLQVSVGEHSPIRGFVSRRFQRQWRKLQVQARCCMSARVCSGSPFEKLSMKPNL